VVVRQYMMEQQKKDVHEGLGIQVLELLRLLAKRKRLIAFITVLTAILSAAYSLTLPNIYSATVKVLPPQKDAGAISSVLGQMGGLAGLAAGGKGGGDTDLYLGIVRSRSVGEAVVKRLDLVKRWHCRGMRDAWNKLDGSIKAAAGKDGIIFVSVEDTDAKLSALIANTVADELGRTLVRLNLSKVGSEKLFLEQRLDVVKRDLKAAEEDLKRFSQNNKIVKVDSQAEASVSGAARLKTEIASKEVELAELRRSQTDESYEVSAMQAGIRRLRAELAETSGNGGNGDGVPSIGNVPQLGLEYSRKMRELKTQEALFEQLSKQYEVAKLNQAKDSSSLQILDEAVVPDLKTRPRRSTLVIMSTLVAFICSVLAVFGLEYLERMPEEEKKLLRQLKGEAFSLR
jgi:tyrosine-protein kinase Etk/Wzc